MPERQSSREEWVRLTLDVGPKTYKALEDIVAKRESGSKAEVLRSLIHAEHRRLNLQSEAN
ncbi:hypothetical protein IID27_03575 [Patescibacteria group bacterium]|nr:hypothetical protein [Patescibacteria group bacterium]